MVSALETITSLLELGGPIVAILFVVSVFSVALIALKIAQFVYCRTGSSRLAQHLVAHMGSTRPSAQGLPFEKQRNTAAGAVMLALRLRAQGGLKKSDIEEEVSRYAMVRLHELQSGFRLLDAIAQLSPLLGLFGTVIGMIDAFQQLQGAGSNVDPSLLAGGIWVALLTTAAGLAVAMPVSLILTLFETRIEKERVAVESLVSEVLSPLRDFGREEAAPVTLRPLGAVHAH